jgi:hypothetical protein
MFKTSKQRDTMEEEGRFQIPLCGPYIYPRIPQNTRPNTPRIPKNTLRGPVNIPERPRNR